MKPMSEQHFAILRRHMVELIEMHMDLMSDELGKSALDERVAAALLEVPRHLFVPAQLIALAYHDTPLPIGFNKTISQPFVAALMIDLLAPQPGSWFSKSAPGSATRPPSWRSLQVEYGALRLWRSSPQRRSSSPGIRSYERDDPCRRRLARMARACAIRQDPGHRRGQAGARTSCGAAQDRRADGHSDRSGGGAAPDSRLARNPRAKSSCAMSFPCGSLSLRQDNRGSP